MSADDEMSADAEVSDVYEYARNAQRLLDTYMQIHPETPEEDQEAFLRVAEYDERQLAETNARLKQWVSSIGDGQHSHGYGYYGGWPVITECFGWSDSEYCAETEYTAKLEKHGDGKRIVRSGGLKWIAKQIGLKLNGR
jgi:hypothetical protein